MTSHTCRRCDISKKLLGTLPLRQKIHHFFFSHTWDTRFKYLPEGCPYMLMYSALHIMQWFSHILDVFTPKIRQNFFNFNIFMNKKKTSLTQDLKWSLNNIVRYKYSLSPVKLICYFVLYYYFLRWAHPPNMAVGDLAFYYTLYLWKTGMFLTRNPDSREMPSVSKNDPFLCFYDLSCVQHYYLSASPPPPPPPGSEGLPTLMKQFCQTMCIVAGST